ncbi:MAG TPA: acyl-CoA thioesterase [Polyangiaceae bacterium]|nr:acyl-CoA thioesterase [Polyangiaceae bacterium]
MNKPPAQSAVTLNTLMMPEHANHLGNVHGGVLMKLVDEAAAICAIRHAQKPAVTVAMDSMTFKQPVQVGDLVTCAARVVYVHKSSMEIEVHVTAENLVSGTVTHTNSAFLVFVALGPDGRAAEVPGLVLESDEDRRAFEAGQARQERRLAARRDAKGP